MIKLLNKMFALGQKNDKAVLVLNLWGSYSITLQLPNLGTGPLNHLPEQYSASHRSGS
jgi:hypothetical protein